MPATDPLHLVVHEWVVKAEHDLLTAAHTLKLGLECPTDNVAFHAQQCVEKYIKALLILNCITFPKVHNIQELVILLPHGLLAHWPLAEQRKLTTYAVIARYPGSGPDVTLAEARLAVRIARKVRREIRKLLPRIAIRRRKS